MPLLSQDCSNGKDESDCHNHLTDYDQTPGTKLVGQWSTKVVLSYYIVNSFRLIAKSVNSRYSF